MHAYAFYVLRWSNFKGASPDWQDWGALLFLTVGMVFALFAVTCFLSIGFQHLLFPRAKGPFLILWGLIYVAVSFVNSYTLTAGRKWSRFEADFRHYSKTMRVLGGIAVWASLIVIVGAALWMSQIAFKLPPYPAAT